MIVNEPTLMGTTLISSCAQTLLVDILSKGPIRLLVYSAILSSDVGPSYSNEKYTNVLLIGEVIIGNVHADGGSIIFTSIPDILNVGSSATANIYEIRSTIGDVLFLRIEGDHRRIANNETLRIPALTVNVLNNSVPLQTDLYPSSSPYPVMFKIEFPLWANNADGYSEMRYNELIMYLNDGLSYDELRMRFPQSKRVCSMGEIFNQDTSDFLRIEGSFSNSNRTFEFTVMPTIPTFEVDNNTPLGNTGSYRFSLSVKRKLNYDPRDGGALYPEWIDADPLVYRKKNGETTYTQIATIRSEENQFDSSYYNENGNFAERQWKFGVLT